MSRGNERRLPTTEEAIRLEYFHWLCEQVDVHDHMFLANKLFKIPFRWFVYNDDNRELEGSNLIYEFADEIGYYYGNFNGDPTCSVLEMMVALARRAAQQLTEEPAEFWFWTMLDNLHLSKFDDNNYYDHGGKVAIEHIINRMVNRTYTQKGEGGLFPVKKNRKDQRQVEIWYQLCYFIEENNIY